MTKLYEELLFTKHDRENVLRVGFQCEDLSKIRCNVGDKKTSGVV